jgi:hypothetical protein
LTAGPSLVGFSQLSPIGAGAHNQRVASLKLSGPALADTFVSVSSSLNGCLVVPGGGVTVPAGSFAAYVLGDAPNACPSVTLTATLGPVSLQFTTSVSVPTTTPLLLSIDTDVVQGLRVGNVNQTVGGVQLSAPATTDTFVAVTSSDTTCMTITAGGATVPAGKNFGPVVASGLKACPSVTLTATLGAVSVVATSFVGS